MAVPLQAVDQILQRLKTAVRKEKKMEGILIHSNKSSLEPPLECIRSTALSNRLKLTAVQNHRKKEKKIKKLYATF